MHRVLTVEAQKGALEHAMKFTHKQQRHDELTRRAETLQADAIAVLRRESEGRKKTPPVPHSELAALGGCEGEEGEVQKRSQRISSSFQCGR